MAEIPRPGSVSFEDRTCRAVPFEWGYGSTPRIAKLRGELKWKAAVVKDWVNVAMGIGKTTFRQGEKIRADVDRARIVTRTYKETEGLPAVIRKAKAVERLCEEMPIFIKPGELIVGDPNGTPDEVRWYPEVAVYYMVDAVMTGGYSEMVSDEERREIVEEICEYWKDKSIDARVRAVLPEELAPHIEDPTYDYPCLSAIWQTGRVVMAYDYEKLLAEGLTARIARAEAKLKELDKDVLNMSPAEYMEKKNNWQAMVICGRAILRYAERLAALAREQAKVEKDKTRRGELSEMASILDWVPANPPRTLHECLQFYWIIEVTAHLLSVAGNGCGARIDQVWWPYYEADMMVDRITRERAVELVECLFLKIQEVGSYLDIPVAHTATSGAEMFYTGDICGTTPDGRDASNDMSCIILEALANLHLNQPPMAVRYHRNISPEVIDRVADCLRAGMGHPSFFNEDLLEKWGLMRGWNPDDARNTQASGCVSNNVKGKFVQACGVSEAGVIFSPRLLEEVLFPEKVAPIGGGLDGPSGKDVREMESADELLDALCERLLAYTKLATVSWNFGNQIITDFFPDPCNSFLGGEEPLERGIDMNKLHKEDDTWPGILPIAQVNVADSLAAVQKLVFDEKKYTMEELLTALKTNWAEREEMRQDFLNAPKYGNDDDFADDWVVRVKVRMNDTIGQVCDAWGNPLTIDGSTVTLYQVAGLPCGASPDGRYAGSFLADGSRSPMTGVDKSGPTAVLNSVGKIPFMHTELFNQRIMPQFVEGENRRLFAEYLREWYDQGTIPHIQFNVVDSGILREAQERPESYTDLQVRVAGYSAFWVDLPKETQESIISRTEQCLS